MLEYTKNVARSFSLLQLTLVRYVHAKKLGSWAIARHFSLSFAFIIASSNVWKYFSFKSILFSSGFVVVWGWCCCCSCCWSYLQRQETSIKHWNQSFALILRTSASYRQRLTYYYCWPLSPKMLGSWMIARHFSLSFASIIASSNIWMCFSFNCVCITCWYVVFGLPLSFGVLPSPWQTYLVSIVASFFLHLSCLVLCTREKMATETRADRFRKL